VINTLVISTINTIANATNTRSRLGLSDSSRDPNLSSMTPMPVKFYRGESQEKTLLLQPEFFLLPSHRERARVLTCRSMLSVCRAQWPNDLGFFYQRFSLPVCNEGDQF